MKEKIIISPFLHVLLSLFALFYSFSLHWFLLYCHYCTNGVK